MRMTKSAQRAAQSIAAADLASGTRRATYCRHWQLTTLTCALHGACPSAATCPDYADAYEFHRQRLRQQGRLLEATRL